MRAAIPTINPSTPTPKPARPYIFALSAAELAFAAVAETVPTDSTLFGKVIAVRDYTSEKVVRLLMNFSSTAWPLIVPKTWKV